MERPNEELHDNSNMTVASRSIYYLFTKKNEMEKSYCTKNEQMVQDQ
jgi:hypothetical protein